MEELKNIPEEDIHRLIKSSMGSPAIPDQPIRKETLNMLKAELQSDQPMMDFPVSVLVLISVMVFLLAFWWVSQLDNHLQWEYQLIGILLGVNLLCIPIGSLIIINRRRHV